MCKIINKQFFYNKFNFKVFKYPREIHNSLHSSSGANPLFSSPPKYVTYNLSAGSFNTSVKNSQAQEHISF